MRQISKIAFSLLIVATLSSCEKVKVRQIIAKERNAQVVWLREDSCFTITRPLMSARYKATNATRAMCDIAHDDLMRLRKQMDDRENDHGGLKLRCYWVGYTYDGKNIDSTVVMVEPSGELVTELNELQAWLDASEEIGRISNQAFSR